MMRASIPNDHPLRHFFSVLAERSFLHYLRWDDLHVTSYIGELLLKFIDTDQLYLFVHKPLGSARRQRDVVLLKRLIERPLRIIGLKENAGR